MREIRTIIVIVTVCVTLALPALAQDAAGGQVVEQKLFEYPTVPDTISTLENRTNYLVQHFWDSYDFSKPIKDVAVFESTFRDYVTFFKYAHKTIVVSSIKDIMRKAESNKSTFLTMAEMAEKSLYADGAEYWSDEAYMPFLESVMGSSMLKKQEKERYKYQYDKLSRNLIGSAAPNFELRLVDGSKKKLSEIEGKLILLFFNDDECADCTISRLRLSTDVSLNRLIREGQLVVVSIYPGKYSAEWANRAKGYSNDWIIGANADIDDTYDLRISPSVYILDENKVILDKNITVEAIKRLVN